ncbi:hypothetical protein SAMN05192559_1066 [Halobacillus karajensis]|uniref:Uncharacterized protein n=1 Tax=Halobacillus karajensis TaxID=195088 RepID=A0A024P788_9BACI|nr:hypothetical protein [Halobacillus karajensis]CDQ21218.1 hypothetical protein BN982_03584 [Halobacillus karajensis]CDQ24720.1 hypothetical protein BN983_03016 [Halobacillus karajensis]CDQ28920.1 hypothetical protein BN981_03238 [Halobacillus karajensis]SEH94701.1 hypothetical protein SAMN05192559_1066 [Halobacillus karajensis]
MTRVELSGGIGYFIELVSNPSFMGALLGAVTTGMISILVFKWEKRSEKVKEQQHYKKLYSENRKNLNLAKTYSQEYKEVVQGKKGCLDIHLEVMGALFKMVIKEIERIGISNIPYDVHNNFVEMRDSLRTISLCADIFHEVGALSNLEEEFTEDVNRYKRNLEAIEAYFNEKSFGSNLYPGIFSLRRLKKRVNRNRRNNKH